MQSEVRRKQRPTGCDGMTLTVNDDGVGKQRPDKPQSSEVPRQFVGDEFGVQIPLKQLVDVSLAYLRQQVSLAFVLGIHRSTETPLLATLGVKQLTVGRDREFSAAGNPRMARQYLLDYGCAGT